MAQGKLEAEPDLSGRAVAALPPASSGAAPAVVRYDIGLEVVLDRATGLEWYRFLQTSSKNSKLMKLCRSMRAASGGWRMPTQAELLTLLEPDKQIGGENPAMVDRVAFPEIREGSLGISTSEMRNKESRWEIDFGRGKADSAHISYGGSTYCVRGEASPTMLARFAPTPPPPPLTTTGAIVDETSGPKPIKSGSSPPFVVEPEVASDASTGLIWLRKPQKFEHHQDFVDKLCWDNTSAGGGWRPPSIIELATLLNPDKKGPDEYDPMIDRAVFSDIRSGHLQVGARDPASGTNQRALLTFHDGETSHEHMTWGGQTLCVRGGDAVERPRPPVSSAAFEVSEAVVRDSRSGLVWQRSDSKATLTYTAAEDYCPKLSLEGLSWRMPQHEELQGLVELGRGAPTIDTAVFPHAASQAYWIEETEHGRHAVEFAFGGLNSKGESETCRVRCVSP